MRSRFIKVFLFTLALSLLALSCCALAYADPGLGTVRIYAPALGIDTNTGIRGFDVQGMLDDDPVSTTDGNAGFRTYLKVGSSDYSIPLASCLLFDTPYTTDDGSVTVSLSAKTGFSGKAAIIRYTVENNTDGELTVRIGSCGDTQVGSDAGVWVTKLNGGFVSESGGLSLLVFPGAEGFSNSWCGPSGQADYSVFFDENDISQWMDNAMAWSWVLPLQPRQPVTRSVVIAVVYSSNRITVNLDPNGGQGAVQRRTAIKGCEYDLPRSTFVRGGYRFIGWATEKDAQEPEYRDEWTVPADKVSDEMTLYAVWEDKAAQTLEANDLVLDFGDTGVKLTAKSSDGKTSFSVKEGSDVIEIDRDSGLIATKKAGEAKVTVKAAATNDSHEATKDVTVTVRPKQLDKSMLTLTPESFDYTGDFQTPALSVKHGETPLKRGTDYELDESSVLTSRELGEYSITITGQGNYSGSVSAVWKIIKRTPTLEVSAYSGVYDGSAHPLVSVAKHTGGKLQFSLQQDGPYGEAIPEAANAGSYAVWYRVVGDEFCLDAGPFSCEARIANKPVAVSGITAADKLYDGSTHAALVFDHAVIDGKCSGDDLAVRSASGMFADADAGQDKSVSISAITLGGAAAGNYELTTLQQQSGTRASIAPRPITIKANDQQTALFEKITQDREQVTCPDLRIYNDELKSVLLTPPSSLDETGTGSITPSRAVIVRSGSTQDTTKNYAITYEPGTLHAQQQELKLSWTDTEFVYDGKSHKPTATVTGMRSGDTLSVLVSGAMIAANAEDEEYTATAAGLSGTNAIFYKLPEEATQTFTIAPRSLEEDEIVVEYRPYDEPSVIGPVPADGKAYGFRTVTVYDGTRRLIKDVDYTLDSNFSTIYGPHTLHIIGKGNYKGSLSHDWTMIGDGLVSASVEVKNGGAPVYWNNASEELADALLDEGDREVREEYGAPTDVYLQIRPAVISSGVAAKAGQLGETIGANYDLSLYKRVGNRPTIIHDTGGIPISVTLDIPEELRKAPLGFYRSFTLIHLNNGSAEVIASGTGRSFTFTTTSFSAYAISYHDIPLPPNSSPPTGDTARLPLWGSMLLLSAGALLALARRKRRV